MVRAGHSSRGRRKGPLEHDYQETYPATDGHHRRTPPCACVSALAAGARKLRAALPLAEVVPDVYDPQRIHYLLQQLTDLVRVAHLTGQKKGATTPPYQGATTSVNRRGASRKRSTNPKSQSKQAADRKGKSKRDKGDPSPEYPLQAAHGAPRGQGAGSQPSEADKAHRFARVSVLAVNARGPHARTL